MLYIFSKKNSVQIAWGSKVPTPRSETRAQDLDLSTGPIGFIRTYSAG